MLQADAVFVLWGEPGLDLQRRLMILLERAVTQVLQG